MIATAEIETTVSEVSNLDPESTSPVETHLKQVSGPRARQHDATVRDTVRTMFLRGIKVSVIASETGLKPGTIKTWGKRYGWYRSVAKMEADLGMRERRVLAIQPAPETAGSAQARQVLANVIQKSAGKLADYKLADKPNLKEIRKIGRALEPLVRSAKIVHNWGTESAGGVVFSDLLGAEAEPQSSIEIDTSVESLSCGSDATTGSVQHEQPAASETQSAQATDSQPATQ